MTTPFGFQRIEYDGLNEDALYTIIYLKAWCPISGTLWKGQGGVVMWEDINLFRYVLVFLMPC